MIRFSQPSNAAALRSRGIERQARQVVTQRRLPAKVIHELAHARLPSAHQLGEGAVITGTRQCDHQGVGRPLQVGGRETALHLE
jgi:hypothetical protein